MCITIRESQDGTLYIALAGGPGIPRVDPLAQRILFDAVEAHNDSIRAGTGPTITTRPYCDRCPGRHSKGFARTRHRAPASLPPVVRLPAQRRRSWRLPAAIAAFLIAICLAAFTVPSIFGDASSHVSRPVIVNFLPPPSNPLSRVTGPEIE